MFHTMAYSANLGVAAANTTVTAVPDTIFMDRNSGFVFTEDWQILWLYTHAASLLRMRSNMPKLNAINRHHIYGINRSLTTPTPFNLQDLRREPMGLSQNESLIWEGSNNLGAATEQTRVVQSVGGLNWSMELPPHLQRMTVRFTAAPTGTLDTWCQDVAITFPDQDLRGGVYSVVGCQCFVAGVPAYRLLFPRQEYTNGRQCRPGGVAIEAVQNLTNLMFNSGLGEWGRFHTFEPFRIQTLSNAAGAQTVEGRVDLLYLGEDEALLKGTM
jgi:hypothetical protein